MTTLIICAIIAGACTLYLVAPLAKTHPRLCYTLMMMIPMISLGVFMAASQHKRTIEDSIKIASHYTANEHYEEAISLLTPIYTKTPENRDLSLQLATAYFAQGLLFGEKKDFEKALNALKTAQKIAPKDAPFSKDLQYFIDIVTEEKTTPLND